MTICVAIKVRDCLVFAADSATSLVETASDGSSRVANIWNHGTKVFNLHKGLPIAAMTAGLAHFGPVSVSNLAKDLRQQLTGNQTALDPDAYTVEAVATKADDFFFQSYGQQQSPPANPHVFEVWIGGFGSADTHGEIWKLTIRDGVRENLQQLVRAEDDDTVLWGGQKRAIARLILGIDPDARSLLVTRGIDGGEIDVVAKQMLTPLVHPAMPVQDAIDLADFLVDVTKRYLAFLPGANVVGGDTDIATVTRHEGFKWIRRKHYYPEHLNRMETDHV